MRRSPTNGWRSRFTSAFGTGGDCMLGFSVTDATLMGDKFEIDGHTYVSNEGRPEAQCTNIKAEELGTAMPCVVVRHLTATRLD